MSSSDEKLGIAMAESERMLLHESNGTAALGICESLLLALIDLKLISDKVAHDLLSDVITTHTNAAELSEAPQKHQAVAEIVQRILSGKVGNGPAATQPDQDMTLQENGEAVASRTQGSVLDDPRIRELPLLNS